MTTGIDFTQSKQYSLSIRLSADGFSFCIHRPGAPQDMLYATYPVNPGYSLTANLKEMLARTEALHHTFRDVTLLIDTPRFTTVPQALFEDEQMEALFYHNFSEAQNETVLCNELGESEVVVVFGMDKHAHQWLNEQYPDARFFATASPLVEHFARKSSADKTGRMYIHLGEQRIVAMAFTDGAPQLITTFACSQTPDRIYHILHAWQQLGMDAERDELLLTGELREKDELLKELRQFVRHVIVDTVKEGPLPYDMHTLMLYD